MRYEKINVFLSVVVEVIKKARGVLKTSFDS